MPVLMGTDSCAYEAEAQRWFNAGPTCLVYPWGMKCGVMIATLFKTVMSYTARVLMYAGGMGCPRLSVLIQNNPPTPPPPKKKPPRKILSDSFLFLSDIRWLCNRRVDSMVDTESLTLLVFQNPDEFINMIKEYKLGKNVFFSIYRFLHVWSLNEYQKAAHTTYLHYN